LENTKQKKQPQLFMKKVMQIGVFAGLFWGAVWYFFYIFSFSEVGPNYFLMPFALGDWKKEIWGNLTGITVMGILSVGVAILYGAFFKKFQGIIPGVIYGLVWWALVFFAVGSLSPVIKSALGLSKETLVTTICIFIIYGVFIAYSVSFEASEEKLTGPPKQANYSNE
jgi:hypothetical protein